MVKEDGKRFLSSFAQLVLVLKSGIEVSNAGPQHISSVARAEGWTRSVSLKPVSR